MEFQFDSDAFVRKAPRESTKLHRFIKVKWASWLFPGDLSLWHVMKWDTAHWRESRSSSVERRMLNEVMGCVADGADGVQWPPPPLTEPLWHSGSCSCDVAVTLHPKIKLSWEASHGCLLLHQQGRQIFSFASNIWFLPLRKLTYFTIFPAKKCILI